MGFVTIRTSFTSRGFMALSPWNEASFSVSALQSYLGSNPISSLEIVSALNSFNLGNRMLQYHYPTRAEKYNPKLYFGTIQTTAEYWNYDLQKDQKNSLGELPDTCQKSGSYMFTSLPVCFSSIK